MNENELRKKAIKFCHFVIPPDDRSIRRGLSTNRSARWADGRKRQPPPPPRQLVDEQALYDNAKHLDDAKDLHTLPPPPTGGKKSHTKKKRRNKRSSHNTPKKKSRKTKANKRRKTKANKRRKRTRTRRK